MRHGHSERGVTLVGLVVAAVLALPAYLGARNKAAIDEADSMTQQWKTLEGGCYLTNEPNFVGCMSNTAIGFNEQPGRYWN